MEIPIFIEPIPGNGYRAIGLGSLGLNAEGATREEVLEKVREQLKSRLQDGAELVSLNVGEQRHSKPWIDFAGMFKGDPYFDEWQEAIAENRRKIDEDPQVP